MFHNCNNKTSNINVNIYIVPMTIWNPNLESYPGPRYKALADAIADDIKAGVLKPQQKLPTHRSLADVLGVTVGTVTRGYAEAEKRELIVARMGSGTFVGSKSNGMSDYLQSLRGHGDQIDMSLSITLSHGQEQVLADILKEIGHSAASIQGLIGYQYEAGSIRHRSVFAEWLRKFGIKTDRHNLVICNGGQNAISTILSALTRTGDRVVSDMLTYPGFTFLVRHHRLRHFGVEMDKYGMITEDLEDICQKHQPRILYCMPNLQNPTSTTLPEQRRREIMEIAKRHDLYVIEDQVQGAFQQDPPLPLFNLDNDRVFFSCSFSKIFAGGLRVGLIVSPNRFLKSVESALYLDSLFAPPLMAEVACNAIESGRLDKLIKEKDAEIRARQQLVDELFEGLDYINQPECPHAWLNLPDPWQADEFVLELQKKGVLVKAVNSFVVSPTNNTQGIRICLTSPRKREQVEKGLALIRDTVDQHPGVWQSIM